MGRSVNISTEIPPPLSMVKRLGIAPSRQKELTAMVQATIERLQQERLAAGTSGDTRETIEITSVPAAPEEVAEPTEYLD